MHVYLVVQLRLYFQYYEISQLTKKGIFKFSHSFSDELGYGYNNHECK